MFLLTKQQGREHLSAILVESEQKAREEAYNWVRHDTLADGSDVRVRNGEAPGRSKPIYYAWRMTYAGIRRATVQPISYIQAADIMS